ncbi:PREDICTED: probable E3 ubiquitin-protein ligase RHA4A [Nicotiana attenuata]|uniref:RING-type E3 ubiquitin transferase n=1 Tax=Nicotiana attenuata TaxID=49451 RepID=A0A314L083_NICAT|nr:PREDICTED: probable E3 ubiquitin-protein ligase RHA4A [Nicotiana attenuata]OIT34855.1 putative e3 ubiquitin-protein ligase rha4a [Nicotiana attenuata]
MGIPESPSPPHLYPQALQLKLYQAFIFSIPILFSIILFLLFYLFYLKRRASIGSISPATVTRSSTHAIIHGEVDIKGMLKNKLPVILFDEDSMMRDSQCCVCLGEFEIKEELHQLPSCKHIFHVECIRHWLRSNFSCPLCRCHVIISRQNPQPPQQPASNLEHNNQVRLDIEEESVQRDRTINTANISREEQHVVIIEELSSASSSSGTAENSERDHDSNVETLVISIKA